MSADLSTLLDRAAPPAGPAPDVPELWERGRRRRQRRGAAAGGLAVVVALAVAVSVAPRRAATIEPAAPRLTGQPALGEPVDLASLHVAAVGWAPPDAWRFTGQDQGSVRTSFAPETPQLAAADPSGSGVLIELSGLSFKSRIVRLMPSGEVSEEWRDDNLVNPWPVGIGEADGQPAVVLLRRQLRSVVVPGTTPPAGTTRQWAQVRDLRSGVLVRQVGLDLDPVEQFVSMGVARDGWIAVAAQPSATDTMDVGPHLDLRAGGQILVWGPDGAEIAWRSDSRAVASLAFAPDDSGVPTLYALTVRASADDEATPAEPELVAIRGSTLVATWPVPGEWASSMLAGPARFAAWLSSDGDRVLVSGWGLSRRSVTATDDGPLPAMVLDLATFSWHELDVSGPWLLRGGPR